MTVLLRDLADTSAAVAGTAARLGKVALLADVLSRAAPEEAAAAVGPPDEGSAGTCLRVVSHHQAPGGGLVDPAQPAAGASTPARPSHVRRVARASHYPGSSCPQSPRVVLTASRCLRRCRRPSASWSSCLLC